MKINEKRILMTLMGLEIGGAETHVLELALELNRRGFYVVCASNGGVYEEVLKENGIKHYKVSLNTKKPSAVLSSLKALKKIIKNEKIDIVHAHGRIPAFVCGILKKTMSYKFTFVTTAHWVFETGHGLKYVTNWGEKTVAVSEDIKKYLMDNYGTNANDIFVTINGIDTNKFSEEADFSSLISEFGLSEQSKKIVYISRMDDDRALVAFHLVEISDKILEKIPNAEIVIVGDGNAFSRLKEKAEEKNRFFGREVIKLAGARTDIYKFAAMSDLFIGVSRSALEAMACSKPVIVAGNEGYMGIFEEEKLLAGIATNFCCRGMEASTAEKLYEDIIYAFSLSEDELKAKGRYGRELILKNYSVKKMAEDNIKMYEAAVLKKRYDAVILGYYGFSNSGDEALLSAIIQNLREIKPDVRLAVLSKDPIQTEKAHNTEAIGRYNYFKVKKALKNSKLLISGGGSLLQDVTSSKSIWYYLLMISLAKKSGAQTMIYANGIGPITKEKNRSLSKKVLNGADYITLRDPRSLEEVKALKISTERVKLTADPALTLKANASDSEKQILKDLNIPQNKKTVCISVRDWKKAGGDFCGRLAEAIDAICEKTGFYPVFVPLKSPEDVEFSQKTANKMKTEATVISCPLNYNAVMELIGDAEMLVGMRLHSLVYAAACGVPTLALSYDPKIDGFAEYIGLENIVSVLSLTKEEMLKQAEAVVKNAEEIKNTMGAAMSGLCALAKENAKIAIKLINAYNGEEI